MNVKRSLESHLRGWFPQEPLNPNKQLQLRLEIDPLKLKRIRGKFTINLAQLIAVVLAFGLILSGLQLNSVSTTKGSYSLPIDSITYHNPVQVDGTSYNCTIHLFISPPLQESSPGPANRVNSLHVYLKDPANISSGSYVTTLRYARYNDTLNAYMPEEFNQTGTFAPDEAKKPSLIFSAIGLAPPFQPSPSNLQPIVSTVVFTLYCNASNPGAGSFIIETPINGAQFGYIVNYPYRSIGDIFLGAGIASLLVVLVISVVNLGKNRAPSPLEKMPYRS